LKIVFCTSLDIVLYHAYCIVFYIYIASHIGVTNFPGVLYLYKILRYLGLYGLMHVMLHVD